MTIHKFKHWQGVSEHFGPEGARMLGFYFAVTFRKFTN